MRKCNKCVYYCPRTSTCDYYIITGKRRGCSVDDCDKFKELMCKRRPPAPQLAPKKPYTPRSPLAETFEILYKLGKSDYAIGKIVGCNRSNVARWRRKMGLPPVQKKKK